MAAHDQHPAREPGRHQDVNAAVGGSLRDYAFAQPTRQQTFGYKRAAAAIMSLDLPLTTLSGPAGELPRIAGVGPGSLRVIGEILERGESPTVERAVDLAGVRDDIERRRALRHHVLSRAEVIRVLRDPVMPGPSLRDYRGDFQMHSEWSDGSMSLVTLLEACRARGYSHAAITDHSHGLRIAGGMSMAEAAAQRQEIERLNAGNEGAFHLLQGVEANIARDGSLDLSAAECLTFEMVLAAPHSILRKAHDQTERMLAAVANPAVHVLAHPRGRISGSRAGVAADWPAVFAAAARAGVAIEIDGDPARQDLDHTLAAVAHAAGCLFALDSDAHAPSQLLYAETAIAHARLAGIPSHRVVNCWPIDRLRAWLADRSLEVRA